MAGMVCVMSSGTLNRNRFRMLKWSLILLNYILTIVFVAGCGSRSDNEANIILKIEQQRVSALVEKNMGFARKLHADDFKLIIPDGSEFTKESYMQQIDTKELDYKVLDPVYVKVLLYDNEAVIRYEDLRFEVFVKGYLARSELLRYINLYEKRNGQQHIVWSHASGVQEP